jgi:SAM-dependent methyltransferase
MNDVIPPNEDDSFQTQFWVKRWEREKLPWDLGRVPPDLTKFLAQTESARPRVLIPGCGSGYEVQAFHQAGYEVEAIDFSGPAVARARSARAARRPRHSRKSLQARFPREALRIDL